MREWHAWHLHLTAMHPDLAERVLHEVIAPAVTDVPGWFFIRYWYRGPHLRLRVRDIDASATRTLAAALGDRLAAVDDGTPELDPLTYQAYAGRMAAAGEEGVPLDTGALRPPGVYAEPYRPELDRYGGPDAMALSEDLFGTSSRLVLAFLRRQPEPAARVGFVLRAMATALAELGDPDRVLTTCRAAATSWETWLREAGRSAADIDRVRALAGTDAERITGDLVLTDGPVRRWADQLADGLVHWRAHTGERRAARILFSHIHMFCNRLGVSVPDELRYYLLLAARTERAALAGKG